MRFLFIIPWLIGLSMGVAVAASHAVVAPVECVGIACDVEHDNGPAFGADMDADVDVDVDVPDEPDAPDEPDEPDEPDDDNDTRPGHGWGDRNHDHTGPPGQNK